jgi:hypothetical protein
MTAESHDSGRGRHPLSVYSNLEPAIARQWHISIADPTMEGMLKKKHTTGEELLGPVFCVWYALRLIPKLRGLSLQTNYNDQATATCWRCQYQLLWTEGVAWPEQWIPTAVFWYSRPNPLLFLPGSSSVVLTRLSGSRSRPTTSQKIWWCRKSNPDLWICSQKLWPLDHRGVWCYLYIRTEMELRSVVSGQQSSLHAVSSRHWKTGMATRQGLRPWIVRMRWTPASEDSSCWTWKQLPSNNRRGKKKKKKKPDWEDLASAVVKCKECKPAPVLIREYGHGDPLHWPCDTLYPQRLALTSPTSGGHSVGIVRSRTKATETVSFCT